MLNIEHIIRVDTNTRAYENWIEKVGSMGSRLHPRPPSSQWRPHTRIFVIQLGPTTSTAMPVVVAAAAAAVVTDTSLVIVTVSHIYLTIPIYSFNKTLFTFLCEAWHQYTH